MLRKEITRLLSKVMSNIYLIKSLLNHQASFWGAPTHTDIIEF